MNIIHSTLIIVIFTALVVSSAKSDDKINYPKTKKSDHKDVYHGTEVADPYNWLEDDRSQETMDWVVEQNKVTFDYLSKIPFRDKFKNRILELNNYPKYGSPFRIGEYYFFTKNDGLQNQSVYYYQKGLNGTPEEFFNPNNLSTDGTVAAGINGVSNDDKYISIGISRSGSDWTEIQVMEIATKKTLEDKVEWCKFSGASWYKDGFFYSRYDAPEAGKEFSKKNEFHKVYYHKLGTKQSEDKLIFYYPDKPLRYVYGGVTDDEKWQYLSVSEGTGGNTILLRKMDKLVPTESDWITIVDGFEFENSVIDNIGDKILMMTNMNAPKFKCVLIDPSKPSKENWVNIIPESNNLLQSVSKAGGKLFGTFLADVRTRISQYSIDGKFEKEIELPGIGTAGGFGGKDVDKTLFYTYTSFNYPPTIFKFDVNTGKSEVFRKAEVKFNPEDYEVNQVFYKSKDKTKIPMFIVHKKGIKFDGSNPTLLYGYGGFNISLSPGFSPSRIALLEQGGVYVQANLRGGGEYGEEWHQQGIKDKKQNVFDDFISAAEWLIANGYTSKEKLAIQGGSNGGLLVGACMTQRPDLFKVAFPAVGVLDMLKFQKFTVGWGWVDDYGSSDDANMFPYLLKYSPLHNLKKGVCYPATMVTTADHDDRVVPAHSFKYAAALQENHGCETNPVLIRIETKAGHGAGKSLTKAIEEVADLYSFMFYNMKAVVKF